MIAACRCSTGTGAGAGAATAPLPPEAYFVVQDGDGPQVWRWRADGGAAALTHGPARHVPLAASAQRVLVARMLPGQDVEQLGWLTAADGQFRPLSPPLPRARRPSWRGGSVAYESGARGLSNVALAAAGDERLVSDAPLGDFEPQLAPDGGFVVFVSSRTGDPELYVQCLSCDAGPSRLTFDPREDTSPQLSGDGRALAFLSNRDGVDQLYLLERWDDDGGAPKRLSVHAAATPRFSPDGQRLFFTRVDGVEATGVSALELPLGAERALTPTSARDSLDAVAPDGRWLGTTRVTSRGSEAALLSVDGGDRVRVSPEAVREAWGVVFPEPR